jgi:hypothetical protein
MHEYGRVAHRRVTRSLIGLVAALGLGVPVLAGPGENLQEKNEAAKVANKLDKALGTARQSEALRHFQEEMAEYAVLHGRQLAKVRSREPAHAPESVAAQKALARAIQAKRVKARQGDIFRPEIEPLFRRLIAEQLEGPDNLAARKAIREGNPGQEEDTVPVEVRVNAEYPPGAARSTVPPSLLLTLPSLPTSLQYRFVGRDLLLVDAVAQLIVDFLPAATPDLGIE